MLMAFFLPLLRAAALWSLCWPLPSGLGLRPVLAVQAARASRQAWFGVSWRPSLQVIFVAVLASGQLPYTKAFFLGSIVALPLFPHGRTSLLCP